MLWYKSWLETRWRFLIGLGVLLCSAVATVAAYPRVVQLLPAVTGVDTTTAFGRAIKESADLARDYRGYIWSQWFRQNMMQVWTIFAALLGAGGVLAETSRGGALFTLSMPVSRARLVGTRAAAGLAELFVLALLPALVIPLTSGTIGQSYGLADALVHATCMFVAGATFFSLAVLLSTVFSDAWRPPLLVIGIAVVLAAIEKAVAPPGIGIFDVMGAQSYFRTGHVPWMGLLATAAVAAALIYAAIAEMEHHDF